MFESTKIIGQLQYQKAKELFESTSGQLVKGDVRLIYENINMTDRVVTLANGTKVTTCPAALGMSFAAGTTDGEGASFVSDSAEKIVDISNHSSSSSRAPPTAMRTLSGTCCGIC